MAPGGSSAAGYRCDGVADGLGDGGEWLGGGLGPGLGVDEWLDEGWGGGVEAFFGAWW